MEVKVFGKNFQNEPIPPSYTGFSGPSKKSKTEKVKPQENNSKFKQKI